MRGGDRADPQRPAGLPPAGVSVRLRRTVLCCTGCSVVSEAEDGLCFGPHEGRRARRGGPGSCLSRGCRPGPRSPPRPSPGGLHYSDEDVCGKYNGAVLAEAVSLEEKSVDASESEVSARGRRPPLAQAPRVLGGPHGPSRLSPSVTHSSLCR